MKMTNEMPYDEMLKNKIPDLHLDPNLQHDWPPAPPIHQVICK